MLFLFISPGRKKKTMKTEQEPQRDWAEALMVLAWLVPMPWQVMGITGVGSGVGVEDQGL
jgi:hypothetical protein